MRKPLTAGKSHGDLGSLAVFLFVLVALPMGLNLMRGRARLLALVPAVLAFLAAAWCFRQSRIPQPELGDVADGFLGVVCLIAGVLWLVILWLVEVVVTWPWKRPGTPSAAEKSNCEQLATPGKHAGGKSEERIDVR